MRPPSLRQSPRAVSSISQPISMIDNRFRSESAITRSRRATMTEPEVSASLPLKSLHKFNNIEHDFKVPDSPTTKLSKMRISIKDSPSKSTATFVTPQKFSLGCRNSEPISRTPQRASKDEAMARILNCFDRLSAFEEVPETSRSRFLPRNSVITKRATVTGTRRPCHRPKKDEDEDRSFSAGDSTSSESSGDYSSEDSTTLSNSSNSFEDEWDTTKTRSKFAKKLPQPSTPNVMSVPKRTDGSSVNAETLNIKLQSSQMTASLPCRENEFDAVFEFLIERLQNRTGGCMYISGVPGTGKTATVTAVLETMTTFVKSNSSQDANIPPFTVVNVNGMQVSEPRQTYVQIYEALIGSRVSANKALTFLEAEFCAPTRVKHFPVSKQAQQPACVLVIDELDLLCSKRQDVLYSLFDWPCRQTGRRPLIVLAIANTMDLPERLLHHRVASRLGLNRLPFAPYSHEQLAEIVRSRLGDELSRSFAPKTIELATRKVAAVSGDARRALDICRRAVELAQMTTSTRVNGCELVTMSHITAAVKEMFSSVKLMALRALSKYEKLLLRAIVAETSARASEEVRLDRCIEQVYALCTLDGHTKPTDTEVFAMIAALGAYKIIITEASRRDTNMLIRLNCSQSDVLFALRPGND